MDDKDSNYPERTDEADSAARAAEGAEPEPSETECSECGKAASFFSIYDKAKVVFCSPQCHSKRNEKESSPNLILVKSEGKERNAPRSAAHSSAGQTTDGSVDPSMDVTIYEACHGGLAKNTILYKLLEGGADVNQRDENDQPLIIYAVANGDVTTLNLLLEKGADINQPWKGQATPLMMAAEMGAKEKVSFLLGRGADTLLKDEEGKTALHRLDRNRNTKCAELLVEQSPDLLHAVDNCQQTALHQAAGEGNKNLVEFLLEKGANFSSLDNLNRSALHWAVIQGMETVVATLLDHECEKVINEPDRFGVRPIHYAIQSNRSDIAEMLITKGCELEAGEARGLTALIYAASCGKRDMLELIIPHCKNVNVTDLQGWTALHHAAKRGDEDVCQLLLDHRADTDIQDSKLGHSPLFVAVWGNHDAVVRLLVERNSTSREVKDMRGRLPLHYAAEAGRLEMLSALVQRGQGDDAPQEEGKTSHGEVATINSTDNSGHTALYLAAQNNHRSCCQHLLENGAEVDDLTRDMLFALGLVAPEAEEEEEGEEKEEDEDEAREDVEGDDDRSTKSPRERYRVEQTEESGPEDIEHLDLGALADAGVVALNSRYIYEGHGPPPKNSSPRRGNSKMNMIPRRPTDAGDDVDSFHVEWKKLLASKRRAERGVKARKSRGHLQSRNAKSVGGRDDALQRHENPRNLSYTAPGQPSCPKKNAVSTAAQLSRQNRDRSGVQNAVGRNSRPNGGLANEPQHLSVQTSGHAGSTHSNLKRYSYSVVTR